MGGCGVPEGGKTSVRLTISNTMMSAFVNWCRKGVGTCIYMLELWMWVERLVRIQDDDDDD